jgi:hypothetical protein
MAKRSKTQTQQKWLGILKAWRQSGQKASVFCRKNRLSLPSFYAWKSRLMGKSRLGARRSGTFLPVRIRLGSPSNGKAPPFSGNPVAGPWAELGLKNGRVLRLYREMPAPALAEMAQALEAEAC